MTDLDQTGDFSFTSDSEFDSTNISQQEHDDSAELIDIDKLAEKFQTEVLKWLDGLRRKRQGEAQKLVPLEKSLNEVQAALRNLKQNVDIPEVTLEFNPHIVQIVESAKAQGRKPNAADLGELVHDSEFLNSLQNGVNRWIEAIRKVTRMDRDPTTGTALQEATFWMNLERALVRINEIRESDEVVITLEALKAGKRFHATVSFDSDTGLKEMLATAADHNQLMKDIPLNELLAASDLDAIHANFCDQLIQLLKPRLLMHTPMAKLEKIMNACKKIWPHWNNEADEIKTISREMVKKQRTTIKFLYRNMYKHKELEKRLEDLYKFRRQHEQLISNVISRVHTFQNWLENIGSKPEKEVAEAYDAAVKEVNYLDLSQAGQQAWEVAMQCYKEHIIRIGTELASCLRDQLGGAKNADEMFSIFSQFKIH